MIGQKLGSFRLEEKIGSGAMGVVYRAVHETTGKTAAIKILVAEVAQKGNAAKRFRREADILQQFRHPNIVRFFAVGRSQGTSYFAMEFVRGKTLDDLLTERLTLPWREAAAVGLQVCEALQYTHDRGVFHRDLKPSNLMVAEDGTVKLTDFGIAKDEDATALTATGRTLGTAAYMAPEQIRGTPEVSHKTDLYSLGIMLYQLLVGETPFTGKSTVVLMHAHLAEPAPRAGEKVEELPRAFDALIAQLLEKDPTARPWDAAAVGLVLSDLLDKAERREEIPMVWSESVGGLTLTQDAPRPREKKPRRPPSSRAQPSALPAWAPTAGLAAALAGLVFLLAYLLWPPGATYLYRRGAALMASENLDDWRLARTEYLDPLLRRFPKDPRRDEIHGWIDKLAFRLAQERAFNMNRGLGRPRAGVETEYDDTRRQAEEASMESKDLVASHLWDDLADKLADRPDDRGWSLLARDRADELRKTMARRRARVVERLAEADRFEKAGGADQADQLRKAILAEYSGYPELADLLHPQSVAPPPGPSPRALIPPAADPLTFPLKPHLWNPCIIRNLKFKIPDPLPALPPLDRPPSMG